MKIRKLIAMAGTIMCLGSVGGVSVFAAEQDVPTVSRITLEEGLKNGLTAGLKNGFVNGATSGMKNGMTNGVVNGMKNDLVNGEMK